MPVDERPELIDIVSEVVNRTESETKKPIRFLRLSSAECQEMGGNPNAVNCNPAPLEVPFHVIRYGEDALGTLALQYEIVHECLHISRTYEALPEKRVTLSDDSDAWVAIVEMLGLDSAAKAMRTPWIKLEQARSWWKLVVAKVWSSTQDLWVDDHLYREYLNTELREGQREYFSSWDLGGDLSRKSKESKPPLIFSIINSMNYACYFLLRKEILGEKTQCSAIKRYSKFPNIKGKGEQLIQAIGETLPKSHEEDVALCKNWSDILGVSKWFFFKRL